MFTCVHTSMHTHMADMSSKALSHGMLPGFVFVGHVRHLLVPLPSKPWSHSYDDHQTNKIHLYAFVYVCMHVCMYVCMYDLVYRNGAHAQDPSVCLFICVYIGAHETRETYFFSLSNEAKIASMKRTRVPWFYFCVYMLDTWGVSLLPLSLATIPHTHTHTHTHIHADM